MNRRITRSSGEAIAKREAHGVARRESKSISPSTIVHDDAVSNAPLLFANDRTVATIEGSADAHRLRALLASFREETLAGVFTHLTSPLGLPYDRVTLAPNGGAVAVAVAEKHPATSPSNIGLYLAVLAGRPDSPDVRARIALALDSLAKLERDELGQLYNWYDADTGAARTQSGTARDANDRPHEIRRGHFVSSVDNGNLIVALAGLRAAHPTLAASIDRVLTPLIAGFRAAFLEETPGHAKHGLIRLGYFVENGVRYTMPNHYDRLGSEARTAVAFLEARGDLPRGSLARMAEQLPLASIEYSPGRHAKIFKTWDGGIFQWLLPNILLDESRISPQFATNHHNLVAAMIALGRDGLPAAWSASDLAAGGYEGKSGIAALAEDQEIREGNLTPHALYLMSSVAPELAARALEELRRRRPDAFIAGAGFVDAIDLAEGGNVSRSLLALDQLMSVLAGTGFGKHVAKYLEDEGAGSLKSVYRSVHLGLGRRAKI